MKPYKIVVAYDGTAYHGWQEQAGHATIAGALQESFERVFGEAIKVVGASRTDAGVHALGQVARFYTSRRLSPERLCRSWNGALPKDIHIRLLQPIVAIPGERVFHPQHNVAQKEYHYYIAVKRPMPHWSRYCYFYPHGLDEDKLRGALKSFVGTHDFSSFCAEVWRHEQTVCTIDSIELTYIRRLRMYRIVVRGERFMYNMIRRIVGAALKVASHQELSAIDITTALRVPGIYSHFPTAPAHGLVLRRILYEQ